MHVTRAADSEAQWAAQTRILPGHAGLSPAVVSRVADLILATARAAPPKDRDARYVADADLATLGSSEPGLERSEKQIREEYGWTPIRFFGRAWRRNS